jgi:hypothetical protein
MDLSISFKLQPYYPCALSSFIPQRIEGWQVLTSGFLCDGYVYGLPLPRIDPRISSLDPVLLLT